MKFVVEGEPQGKGRPRFGHGRTYTPKRTKDYELKVLSSWLSEGSGRLSKGIPVCVGINAYFGIPKRTSKAEMVLMETGHIRPQKAPDADNIAKVIMDALNGSAWEDDKQVVTLIVRKWYSSTPRVEVEVRKEDE